MNWVGSSEYITVFTSFTRVSFLNTQADQSSSWLIRIDHFVTILPHYNLCKISKNGNTPPLFKILFFLKYLDLFKTDLFFFFLRCSNQR